MKRPNSTGSLQSGDFIPKPNRPNAAASGGKGGGRQGGNGGNHQPPRLTGASPASPPKKPGLTPVFNAAAKKPHRPPVKTYQQQIADLRKLMSQPKPVRNLTPRGADSNRPNIKRDREIRKNIQQIKTTVAKQREKIKRDFSKAAIRGTTKQSFNRASRKR